MSKWHDGTLPVEPLIRWCGNTRAARAQLATTNIKPGPISWLMADRYAIRLGVHPAAIWGDLWWASALSDDGHEPGTVHGVRWHQRRGEEPCQECLTGSHLEGTAAGYRRHRRLKQQPCQACLDAWNAYSRESSGRLRAERVARGEWVPA